MNKKHKPINGFDIFALYGVMICAFIVSLSLLYFGITKTYSFIINFISWISK